MLERFTSQGAMALGNSWLLAEVERSRRHRRTHRPGNRAHFEAGLDRELARAERIGQSVSLVMLDIDHFKALNDSCGHQAGDVALREVAAVLRDSGRASDLVARYGGEEFALVLPDTDEEAAVQIAERLRLRIREVVAAVPVTASFGVAAYPRSAFDLESLPGVRQRPLRVETIGAQPDDGSVFSNHVRRRQARKRSRRSAGSRCARCRVARSLVARPSHRAGQPPAVSRPRWSRPRPHAAQRGSAALILLDIDEFKQLNDSFGYEAGDRSSP